MDLLTITLITILIILTVTSVTVGIFLILVLKKSKEILENVKNVTDAVSNPITTIAGLVGGAAEGLGAFKSVARLFKGEKEDEDE